MWRRDSGADRGGGSTRRAADGCKTAINIDVDDLERGVAFYTAALGLSVGRKLGSSVIELTGGNAPICLLANADGTFASPTTEERRRYTRHWTPVHLDVAVSNLRERNCGCRRRQA